MNPIVMKAFLVQAADPDCVRLILGPHCLDFAAADIVDVEELLPPDGLIEGSAIAAQVTIQAGARLLRIAWAEAYAAALWKASIPFSLATRPEQILEDDTRMKKAEHAFFQARGLHKEFS